MIKRVSLVRRKPDWTHEAFIAHWMGPHADIVEAAPGAPRPALRPGDAVDAGDAATGTGSARSGSTASRRPNAAFAAEPHASRLMADRELFLGEAQAASSRSTRP